MPSLHRVGATYKIHSRPHNPSSQRGKSFNGHLQRKLEALTEPPTKVTTLAQMSPEKQEEMRRLYRPPGEKR